ncbi:hypothetical protein [uncultured Bartonella sp.]|uniref:hypothetical protein n=1 Tax=uncultured Bartonella sp. TaxID=104108 RepID=UPI0025D88BDA|nr:hypothetical protein [uncultured Bartonella sp.]
MHDLIYSTQDSGFNKDVRYENPKYFKGQVTQSNGVLVIGDWPEVVKAYKTAGIPVEVQNATKDDATNDETDDAPDPYPDLSNNDMIEAIKEVTGDTIRKNTSRAKIIAAYEDALKAASQKEKPETKQETPEAKQVAPQAKQEAAPTKQETPAKQ